MRALKSIAVIFSVLIMLFLISPGSVLAANAQGFISFNNWGRTHDTAPMLSGHLPAECTDVAVVLLDDNGFILPILSEVNLGVSVSSGNWSVSLSDNNITLPYGYYHVYVSSKCGAISYDDPAYSDFFDDSLFVVPIDCSTACSPIHRFYNFRQGAHFYTNSEEEKRSVMEATATYRYEGIIGFSTNADTLTLPVFRFYNFRQGVHFYTTNYDEYINVLTNASWTYRYEGTAYWALRNESGGVPMHRFYKFKDGVHFYTANQAEATLVNDTMYNEYRYEGISYYITDAK